MRDRRKPIAIAIALTALAAPSPAGAQIVFDEDSPSAKEYAIPFQDARDDASSHDTDAQSSAADTAPLFGEGVGDDGASATTTESGNAPSNQGSGGQSRQPEGSDGQAQGNTVSSTGRTVSATVPQGGFSSALTIGAVALSVLLLGGVIGSAFRRRDPA